MADFEPMPRPDCPSMSAETLNKIALNPGLDNLNPLSLVAPRVSLPGQPKPS